MKLVYGIIILLLWKMMMAEERIPMDEVDIISFPSDHLTAFNGTVPLSTEGMHAFCEWEHYFPCDWINTTYTNEHRMECHLNKPEYIVLHAVVNCNSENMELIQGSCTVALSLASLPAKRPLSWKPRLGQKEWEKKREKESRYEWITQLQGDRFVVQIPSIRPSFVAFFCRFNATQIREEWMRPLRNVRDQLQHAYGQIPSLSQLWKDIAIPITDADERSNATYRIAIAAWITAFFATGFPIYLLFFSFFPHFTFFFTLMVLILSYDLEMPFTVLKEILISTPFGRILFSPLPSQ